MFHYQNPPLSSPGEAAWQKTSLILLQDVVNGQRCQGAESAESALFVKLMVRSRRCRGPAPLDKDA
ncbi:hypothetical protein AFE_0307 [Acidithiobacillus ferrooxidans ATCC 23270]|uniref:Uncharacterized protein n=1 Tax=Acidithiobacillus ferrooxidans (strain ATCC 23270 / DSM 14882 / CIP 104768 / NCIMB 8455) TaxID=243159 RepID=B7J451_ACIF2|nr:hypothetical protein AFE_0307 [Acidithiobacillus ferrooxidans ATCC 23270]